MKDFVQNHHFDAKRDTKIEMMQRKEPRGCFDTITRRGLETKFVCVSVFNETELKYTLCDQVKLLAVVRAETHFQNFLFGARFKIIRDHNALLACLLEEKNSKTTCLVIQWLSSSSG